jgi:UDP-glucose 4-epimerase
MPYFAQVAVGRREHLSVFGGDYPTPDGTVFAITSTSGPADVTSPRCAQVPAAGGPHLQTGNRSGLQRLEMVAAFSRACGRDLPYVITERRAGDIASAGPIRARPVRIGLAASRSLDDMTADTWRWQSQNPNGYPGE